MNSLLFAIFSPLCLTVLWTVPAFAIQGQNGTPPGAQLNVQGDLATNFNAQGNAQGGDLTISSNSQVTITKRDILDKMIQMAKKCELVLDCITEYENEKTNDDTIVKSSCLPLLHDLQYQLLKSSCLIIWDASTTANEAALSDFGKPDDAGAEQSAY